MMYGSDLFYENNTLDRARRTAFYRGEHWIYNGIDTHRKALIKRSIRHLENKHYVKTIKKVLE